VVAIKKIIKRHPTCNFDKRTLGRKQNIYTFWDLRPEVCEEVKKAIEHHEVITL